MKRREFLMSTAALQASALLPGSVSAGEQGRTAPRHSYCAFVKFIQSLGPREMARTLRELGYDGAEMTVRPGGYILPEDAEQRLPEVHRIFAEEGVEITIMTTSITSADDAVSRKVLETAAKLEIPRYRMGFCRYDLKEPVRAQVESWQPAFSKLAELNAQLGITGFYQNHAGAAYVGATFWDLAQLLDGIERKHLGVIFDIRHACVEGGLAWPVYYNIIQPHIVAFSMKDCQWKGRKVENVAFGEGLADPAIFKKIASDFPEAPITIHVEYLEREGLQPNVDALRRDLKTVRQSINASP